MKLIAKSKVTGDINNGVAWVRKKPLSSYEKRQKVLGCY